MKIFTTAACAIGALALIVAPAMAAPKNTQVTSGNSHASSDAGGGSVSGTLGAGNADSYGGTTATTGSAANAGGGSGSSGSTSSQSSNSNSQGSKNSISGTLNFSGANSGSNAHYYNMSKTK